MEGKYKRRIVSGIVAIAIGIIVYPFLFTQNDRNSSSAIIVPEPPNLPIIPVYIDDLDKPLTQQSLADITSIGDGSILITSPLGKEELSQNSVTVPPVQGVAVSSDVAIESDESHLQSALLAEPADLVEVPEVEELPAVNVPSRDVATVVIESSGTGSERQVEVTTTSESAQTVAMQSAERMDGNGLPISWSLQLVALASRDNANDLVSRLRAAGYQSFIRESITSGRTLFRVHVGPDMNRERLEAIRPRIDEDFNVESIAVRFDLD